MTTEIISQGTLTTVIPILGDTTVALQGSVNLQGPDLNAQLGVFGGVALEVQSPSVDAGVFVDAGAELAVQPPSIGAEVAAGITGDINLKLAQLDAYLALLAHISGLRGSITLSTYEGKVGNFPSEASQTIGGGTNDDTFVVVLSASTSSGIASLKTAFGSP